MTKTRVTIDFAEEPEVLQALIGRASEQKRSLGRQVLFECLPHLPRSTPAKPARKQKGGAK